jgi:hypothetical protein
LLYQCRGELNTGECLLAGDSGMAQRHMRHGLGGRLAAGTSLGDMQNLFLGMKMGKI